MDDYQTDEFNQIILDNIPASIITINKDGYITSANKYYQNFARNKDYRKHNILTSDFFIREKLTNEFKKLFKDGRTVRRENCYEKNSQGEDKYFRLAAFPIRDKKGNIEGAISIGLDNTEVILAEKKLIKLNTDLEKIVKERTRELDRVNDKLNKILNLKSTFMEDVSHELRNPLAVIQLELELLSQAKDCTDKENFKEPLNQIFAEIKRMATMMTDLFLLANSNSTKQSLNYQKIDLNRLIESVIKSIKIQADQKNIAIEHKNKGNKVGVMVDKKMIEKLISNLIRNAIKYNRNNGWIKVWTEKTENEIILKVADSGIGISKKDLPNIFTRFYRAGRVKSGGKSGSGLGLAICKLITERHNGTITVESTLGQGSIFTVKIPPKLKKG